MQDTVAIQEMRKKDVLILVFKGKLDEVSSMSAEKKILDFVDKGENRIILNFSELSYLSSAGMRLLIRVTKKVKSSGGKLIVCSIPSPLLDVFKMSGVDHVIEFANDEEEALKNFSFK